MSYAKKTEINSNTQTPRAVTKRVVFGPTSVGDKVPGHYPQRY